MKIKKIFVIFHRFAEKLPIDRSARNLEQEVVSQT